MPTTPYMDLVQPTPTVTPGPEWAVMLNLMQELIDAHDHTSGKGVQINQAGININGDFTLNQNPLLAIMALVLTEYGSLAAGNDRLRTLFVYNGDAYYRNAAGQAVQLTSGGALAVSGAGAISWKLISAYPYSIVLGDAQKILGIDCSADRVVNLPAASLGSGMYLGLKDYQKMSMVHPITLTLAGSDLLEGDGGPVLLASEDASWNLLSDGVSNWYFV